MITMRRVQRGSALAITLIMLMVMTLMTVTTFTIGNSSLQIIGNMSMRNQTLLAAMQSSEAAISTARLITSPTQVLFNGSTYANSQIIDINSDGKTVINVALSAPNCKTVRPILGSTLDFSVMSDLACASTNSLPPGVQQSAPPTSNCAGTTWEFGATATDNLSSASSTVIQGVYVRANNDQVLVLCP